MLKQKKKCLKSNNVSVIYTNEQPPSCIYWNICCFIIHVPGHTLFRSSIVLELMLCFLLELKKLQIYAAEIFLYLLLHCSFSETIAMIEYLNSFLLLIAIYFFYFENIQTSEHPGCQQLVQIFRPTMKSLIHFYYFISPNWPRR